MNNLKISQSPIKSCYITLLILVAATIPSMAAVRLPDLTVPNGFGVNIHFRGEPRDLDLICDAGLKFIRMDLTWSGVERQKGVYDFDKTGYDALTTGCTRRGIRILYILDYSNRLYESDRSVRTEQGRKAFADFAEAAAKRYKGKGILWELWNEPNLRHFWSPQPSADDYCKLVEETAPRIKKADPSGLIVAPATSGIPFGWLEECFKKGLLKWLDVLSVHPYRSKPPETVIADYDKLRKLIKQYAPADKKLPIISGEWGYSNINWNKTRLSNEQQAQFLVREFLINLSERIPVSIWYDWKNDGTNPNEREHNFGTVTHDLKPKKAYLAAKTLSSTLLSYSINQRLDLGSDKDFAFRLKGFPFRKKMAKWGPKKNTNQAIALWTMGKKHEAELPIGPGEGTLIDMLGGKTRLSWKTNILKLTISQSPQYLLLQAK